MNWKRLRDRSLRFAGMLTVAELLMAWGRMARLELGVEWGKGQGMISVFAVFVSRLSM
jgi:hypothetical protein